MRSMRVHETVLHIRRGLEYLFLTSLFITLFSGFLLCDCEVWTATDFPNPRLEPERCGFIGNYTNDNISRRVCDPDGIMTSQEVILLNELVLNLTSSCICEDGCDGGGFPIAIAVANRIQSSTSHGGFEPAVRKCKSFAETLHKKWFPDDGCQDTSLIFFCFHYKELSISLDREVERVFSDLEIAALAGLGKEVLGPDAYTVIRETNLNLSQTFIGLEQVLTKLHDGIENGPSLTSFTLYLIAVPSALLALIAIMCILANWSCRPDLEATVDPQSGKHNGGHTVR